MHFELKLELPTEQQEKPPDVKGKAKANKPEDEFTSL
jgi:hypothetical protein